MYDTTSPNVVVNNDNVNSDDVYSGMDEVYDHIDDRSHYTGLHDLQVEKPKKEIKEEDLPTEAPEPPPLRPHVYLELVNLWDSVLETVANTLTTDLTTSQCERSTSTSVVSHLVTPVLGPKWLTSVLCWVTSVPRCYGVAAT